MKHPSASSEGALAAGFLSRGTGSAKYMLDPFVSVTGVTDSAVIAPKLFSSSPTMPTGLAAYRCI